MFRVSEPLLGSLLHTECPIMISLEKAEGKQSSVRQISYKLPFQACGTVFRLFMLVFLLKNV